MGVRGINLTGDDGVIGMQLDSQGEALLIVSANGMGKRTLTSEFTTQHRGGKGIKCYKITEKTGDVVGVKAVNDDNEIRSDHNRVELSYFTAVDSYFYSWREILLE